MIDNDYKFLLIQQVKQDIQMQGGHNKEIIIMLTIRTFKLFCLKAGTKKVEQINEYYIKLEDPFNKIKLFYNYFILFLFLNF